MHTMHMGKAHSFVNVGNGHLSMHTKNVMFYVFVIHQPSILIHVLCYIMLVRTTVIDLIIKNKVDNLSDNDNYIHIALATIASKLLEPLTLSRVSNVLTTCANKFGF